MTIVYCSLDHNINCPAWNTFPRRNLSVGYSIIKYTLSGLSLCHSWLRLISEWIQFSKKSINFLRSPGKLSFYHEFVVIPEAKPRDNHKRVGYTECITHSLSILQWHSSKCGLCDRLWQQKCGLFWTWQQ